MHTEPLGRRGFMRTALTGAAGALAVEGADEHSPAALPPGQLFSDPEFAFTTQIGLGASYYGTSNPGKLFSIATDQRWRFRVCLPGLSRCGPRSTPLGRGGRKQRASDQRPRCLALGCELLQPFHAIPGRHAGLVTSFAHLSGI